jgi:guanylate kinase
MSAKKTETKLVVLSAPSGTGKSTLAGLLLKHHPQFQLSISYTTRAPRGAEKNGTHYYFVDDAQFQDMVKQGKFLEHAHVFGKSWYGTARETVETSLKAGFHVLFDIDVQGAASLKKAFGQRCITVFILPPSMKELEERLRNRKTESQEAIDTRLRTARLEIAQAPSFDYQIINNDLDETFKELESVLKKEQCII